MATVLYQNLFSGTGLAGWGEVYLDGYVPIPNTTPFNVADDVAYEILKVYGDSVLPTHGHMGNPLRVSLLLM